MTKADVTIVNTSRRRLCGRVDCRGRYREAASAAGPRTACRQGSSTFDHSPGAIAGVIENQPEDVKALVAERSKAHEYRCADPEKADEILADGAESEAGKLIVPGSDIWRGPGRLKMDLTDADLDGTSFFWACNP